MAVNRMNMIVGLGNPGDRYCDTRHNVGFMLIDKLAGEKTWGKSKSGLLKYVWLKQGINIELIKPLIYMNRSGEAVGYAMKKHVGLEMNDLWVAHDDLDIELGKYKIQKGRGPKKHNGVESVEKALRAKDFWRVRVGVENRSREVEVGNQRIPGEKYVLSNFTKEEREMVDDVLGQIIDEIGRRVNELV